MKMKMKILVVVIFSFFNIVSSHSWISNLRCVDTGEVGYIRGYQGRDQIQDFDLYMTYLLEGRNKEDLICSPHQREDKYYPDYPKLSCPAGSKVTFEYNTNGHVITDVCLPGDPRGCKPDGHTADTFWAIFMNDQVYPNQLIKLGDINNDPKFNDDSGLINYITKGQKFNFNDACGHESSEVCTGEFTIPNDVVTDRDYQFVFYWELNRDFHSSGEIYTSCFDIYITLSSIPTVTPVPTPCSKITPTPTPTNPNCRTVINP